MRNDDPQALVDVLQGQLQMIRRELGMRESDLDIVSAIQRMRDTAQAAIRNQEKSAELATKLIDVLHALRKREDWL